MKKDIETVKDIELLIFTFFNRLKSNPLIGYIFTEMTVIDGEKYVRAMVDFWENVLFHTGVYSGNPLKVHQYLHKLYPLTAAYFSEWSRLFDTTTDELFAGEKATLVKHRSAGISAVMQLEILNGGKT